jgi:membrane protein YdbS with pleckstrin-like domain
MKFNKRLNLTVALYLLIAVLVLLISIYVETLPNYVFYLWLIITMFIGINSDFIVKSIVNKICPSK